MFIFQDITVLLLILNSNIVEIYTLADVSHRNTVIDTSPFTQDECQRRIYLLFYSFLSQLYQLVVEV